VSKKSQIDLFCAHTHTHTYLYNVNYYQIMLLHICVCVCVCVCVCIYLGQFWHTHILSISLYTDSISIRKWLVLVCQMWSPLSLIHIILVLELLFLIQKKIKYAPRYKMLSLYLVWTDQFLMLNYIKSFIIVFFHNHIEWKYISN